MGSVDADRERFEALYDAHAVRVLAYALRHVDPSEAEDVVAETFATATGIAETSEGLRISVSVASLTPELQAAIEQAIGPEAMAWTWVTPELQAVEA